MCSLFGHFKAAGFGGLQRQKAFVVDCLTQHVIPHFLLGGQMRYSVGWWAVVHKSSPLGGCLFMLWSFVDCALMWYCIIEPSSQWYNTCISVL